MCVNITNDQRYPYRVGREIKTKLCIGKDDGGLGYGA